MKTKLSCAVVEIADREYKVTDTNDIDYNSAPTGKYSSKSYFLVSAFHSQSAGGVQQDVTEEISGLERELRRAPSLEEIREKLNSKSPNYQVTQIDYELKSVIHISRADCFGMPYNHADD